MAFPGFYFLVFTFSYRLLTVGKGKKKGPFVAHDVRTRSRVVISSWSRVWVCVCMFIVYVYVKHVMRACVCVCVCMCVDAVPAWAVLAGFDEFVE